MKAIITSVAFCVAVACPAIAQSTFSPWFVVIGAFKNEENAKRQCLLAHEQNLPAVYAYNTDRAMYYVYVRATQSRDVAYDIVGRLQTGTVFKDAWLFNGELVGQPVVATETAVASNVPVDRTETTVPDNTELVQETEPETTPAVVVQEEVAPVQRETRPPVGKPMRFVLINRETGNPVNGIIRLFEDERSNQFKAYNPGQTVYVPAPSNKDKRWLLLCQIPGFKAYKRSFIYDEIATGQEEIVLTMELQRVKRGDYIEMEGVKFYNNAALLAPGSEIALDDLYAMLEENQRYKIRLRGHTNGTHARDIVTLGTSEDLFHPSVDNEKRHVPAKELALLRAEVVKLYLVRKGVEPTRITTKGEGGTQMIYDPRGTLAGLNDRVEVEIRKH